MAMKDERQYDPSLRRALSAWRADVDLPLDFQRSVWDRIRRQEERRASRWLWLGEAVNWLAADLRLAAAAPALAVAIGFLLGLRHDPSPDADAKNAYQIAYVDSLDPYALASRHREGP